MQFKKICLAYNSHRQASLDLLNKYENVLNELEIENIKLPLSMIEPFSLVPKQLKDIELVIVFGGDGTLLTAARKFSQHGTPVLGINVGHLGFLTEANNPVDIKEFLTNILQGRYQSDIRTMIQGEILRKPDESYENVQSSSLLALNDIVISRSSRSHILKINLEVDGSEIAEYMADGVIVCTPTGSTAYSLAAGGAVLDPSIQGIGVIPICAHSLTSRPLIIADTSSLTITITPRNRKQSLITVQADGQETFLLEPEDSVLIKKSEYSTKLIRSESTENNFYKVLSKKLLWGRSR
ncbi:MAG: NAD(+)/NADH kinase [Candidatus Caenarcaniphilales bacterium]|nr:NAD(+)/NADH kinase [Candidatus Caenarcaniphilales bacterium]